MKTNQTTLSKEDFIQRSMNGERFTLDDSEYCYDSSRDNPFRVIYAKISSTGMASSWKHFDGKTIFIVVTPKKTIVIEEWLIQFDDGESIVIYTSSISLCLEKYIPDVVIKTQKLSERTVEVEVDKAQS